MVHTIEVPDLEGTESFGRWLGARLFAGAVVGLIGPLGAGKTHLARAVAEGLGIADRRAVSSPTFVLIQEYEGRLPIYHFDAYRLKTAAEFVGLGAHEYFQGAGVCLVEWADRVEACLPADRLTIAIDVVGPTARRFRVAAGGPGHTALVAALAQEKGFAR